MKQRDTKGSWIVDRGSWIEDPKCPVLPGIMIPSETEISKNLEKEARNESWAEENKLHSCFTLDEESQPETSIEKGEVETDKAKSNIREEDNNKSTIEEKESETKK